MEKIIDVIKNWIKNISAKNIAYNNESAIENKIFSLFYIDCSKDKTVVQEIKKEINDFEKHLNEKYKVSSKTIITKDGEVIEEHDF